LRQAGTASVTIRVVVVGDKLDANYGNS
jgi:hypothetical protein